jgi:uncharacterized membrane protein
MVILLILFYLAVPFLVLYLCHIYRFVNKLGSVVVAYIIGLLIGNLGILPTEGAETQELLSNITIPLAIPLMLFSTKLREVFKMAHTVFVSLMVGVLSVVVVVVTGFFIFRDAIPAAWKVSGLLVGVYTGGTPNLAALKLILNVDDALYLVTHSADLIVGVFYLFFLMTFGQRFFSKFLKPSAHQNDVTERIPELAEDDIYSNLMKIRNLWPFTKALVLALLVAATSVLVSILVPQGAQMAVVMLLITTFSLGLSFVPAVNRIPKTFDLGMYFVLVFSVVVASMVNVTAFTIDALDLVYFVTWVVFGSLLVQIVLSRIFKIDADTVIITSTALICSPAFVPVIAGALRNRNMVVPGLTIGIIGYAIGNYLGFVLAHILKQIV